MRTATCVHRSWNTWYDCDGRTLDITSLSLIDKGNYEVNDMEELEVEDCNSIRFQWEIRASPSAVNWNQSHVGTLLPTVERVFPRHQSCTGENAHPWDSYLRKFAKCRVPMTRRTVTWTSEKDNFGLKSNIPLTFPRYLCSNWTDRHCTADAQTIHRWIHHIHLDKRDRPSINRSHRDFQVVH